MSSSRSSEAEHSPPRLLNATLANALAQIWLLASLYGSGIITARHLSLNDKGAYRLVTMVPTIVFMFSELGLGAATVYFLGKKRFESRVVLGHLLMACPIAGALGFAGFFFLLPSLRATVLQGVPWDSLIAVGLSVPLTLLAFVLGNFLLAAGRYRQYNVGLSIAATVKLIALFLLVVVGRGDLMAATFAWIIGEAIHVGWVSWQSWRVTRPRLGLDADLVKSFLRYGIQVQFVGLFLLANLQIDTLLLSDFAGEDNSIVGLYAVSMSVSKVLLCVSTAASIILTPRLSAANKQEAAALTCRAVRWTVWLALLSGLGLAAISPWLIPFAFGDRFAACLPALWMLIPGAVLYGGSLILNSFLNMQGRPIINAIAGFVALFTNTILTITLMPSLGGLGSAVGSTCSYLAFLLILAVSFRLFTGRTFRELLVPTRQDWRELRARWSGLRSARRAATSREKAHE